MIEPVCFVCPPTPALVVIGEVGPLCETCWTAYQERVPIEVVRLDTDPGRAWNPVDEEIRELVWGYRGPRYWALRLVSMLAVVRAEAAWLEDVAADA